MSRLSNYRDGWQLMVSDDGVGTPPDRKPGLGSGLIKQFVRQAGGMLTVAGGNGTLAVIHLPATAASTWKAIAVRAAVS